MPLFYNVLGSVSTYSHLGILSWEEVTAAAKTIEPNKGYVANNAIQVVFSLPISSNIGDRFEIIGKGVGGWAVDQRAGQTIHFGEESSTTGVSGGVSSAHFRDTVQMVCIQPNTDWEVITSVSSNILIS